VEAQLKEKEGKICTIVEAQLKEKEGRICALEELVATLAKEVADQAVKICTLEAQLMGEDRKICALESQVVKMSHGEQISMQGNQLTDINTTVTTHEEQLGSVTEAVNGNQSKVSTTPTIPILCKQTMIGPLLQLLSLHFPYITFAPHVTDPATIDLNHANFRDTKLILCFIVTTSRIPNFAKLQDLGK
jgi:hypothetical protein